MTLNIGEIHGGTAVNIVPDEAHITLGFRPLPDTSIDDMVARINEVAHKELGESKATITTHLERCSPPMMTKQGSRLEQILKPLANDTGSSAAQYSTDGGNISQHGIDCLIFGPGTIDIAHQANEWIAHKDLLSATEKLNSILGRWFT